MRAAARRSSTRTRGLLEKPACETIGKFATVINLCSMSTEQLRQQAQAVIDDLQTNQVRVASEFLGQEFVYDL